MSPATESPRRSLAFIISVCRRSHFGELDDKSNDKFGRVEAVAGGLPRNDRGSYGIAGNGIGKMLMAHALKTTAEGLLIVRAHTL